MQAFKIFFENLIKQSEAPPEINYLVKALKKHLFLLI